MNIAVSGWHLLGAVLRNDFPSFIRKTFATVSPGVDYRHNWHIEAIAWHLNEVASGRLNRLIVTVPPRNLKSIIASVALPSFVLGHDPTRRIIAVSYSGDLAKKHSTDFRSVLRADWYRQTFPETAIDRKKDTEAEVRTSRRGFRYATSVGGTLTGRGGDLIIIDDPLKPQDAFSASKRQFVNDWYSNTLLSRLDDKRSGAIVIVMQRLHVDDLVGHLIETQPGWHHLDLPAIAEHEQRIRISDRSHVTRRPGDLLHPEREPHEILDELKAALGASVFSAQYQQAPVPEGGAMIKREWIKRYTTLPPHNAGFVVQSWDTAQKPGQDNDFSAGTTWFVCGSTVYLMDVARGRFDYPTLKREVLPARVTQADCDPDRRRRYGYRARPGAAARRLPGRSYPARYGQSGPHGSPLNLDRGRAVLSAHDGAVAWGLRGGAALFSPR